jgi:hypothetical protein
MMKRRTSIVLAMLAVLGLACLGYFRISAGRVDDVQPTQGVAQAPPPTTDAPAHETAPCAPPTAPEFEPDDAPLPEPSDTDGIAARLKRLETLLLAGDIESAAAYFELIRTTEHLSAPALLRAKEILQEERSWGDKKLVVGYLACLFDHEALSDLLDLLFADWALDGSADRIDQWKQYDAATYVEQTASAKLNEQERVLCSAVAFAIEKRLEEWISVRQVLELITTAYRGMIEGGHPGPAVSGLLTAFNRALAVIPSKQSHPLVDFIQVIAADVNLPERVRFQAKYLLASRVTDLLTLLEALGQAGESDASKAVAAYLESVPTGSWELSAIYDALISKYGRSKAITVMQFALSSCKVADHADTAKALVAALFNAASSGGSMFTNQDDALAFAVICVRSVAGRYYSSSRRKSVSGGEDNPLVDPAQFDRLIGMKAMLGWRSRVGDRYMDTTKGIYQWNTFNVVMDLAEPLESRLARIKELLDNYEVVSPGDATTTLGAVSRCAAEEVIDNSVAVVETIKKFLSRVPKPQPNSKGYKSDMARCCGIVTLTEKLLRILGYPKVEPTDEQLSRWRSFLEIARDAATGKYGRLETHRGNEAIESLSLLGDAGSDLGE